MDISKVPAVPTGIKRQSTRLIQSPLVALESVLQDHTASCDRLRAPKSWSSPLQSSVSLPESHLQWPETENQSDRLLLHVTWRISVALSPDYISCHCFSPLFRRSPLTFIASAIYSVLQEIPTDYSALAWLPIDGTAYWNLESTHDRSRLFTVKPARRILFGHALPYQRTSRRPFLSRSFTSPL
ncbi:hypothetical protein BDW59DRAFT_114954 [Aspergillus cavernicola]|uniref:Uncharacterized protein n=1 Tax=Aspergillus cavernicola TaxID=176166 RepID=A0ABR4IWA1_9EURO